MDGRTDKVNPVYPPPPPTSLGGGIKRIKKEKQKIEGTHQVDMSLEMATVHQLTIPLMIN